MNYDVWEKLLSILQTQAIPKKEIYEIPLPILGYILWPEKDFNQLKYLNKTLAKLLRSKGIKIIRKHGVRYAQIPIDKIKGKKKEANKVMACEAWRW
jgi:hypothetical protein